MRLIAALRQRIADYRRERRIRALVLRCCLAAHQRDYREHWVALRDEINARSPGQVARMERKRGLRT